MVGVVFLSINIEIIRIAIVPRFDIYTAVFTNEPNALRYSW